MGRLIDGQPLYAYGVLSEEFPDLQSAVVGAFRHRGWDNTATSAKALVLWLAEWSFRYARRINGFWKDVSEASGVNEAYLRDYNALRLGFSQWQRHPPKDDGARWIIAILREGGFPTNFVTSKFEDVVWRLVQRFGWDQLQKSDVGCRDDAIDFLRREGDHVAWLRSSEAAEYMLGFFTDLATYRNRLSERSLLPAEKEDVDAWTLRLPLEERPDRHLPLRGQKNTPLLGLFVNVSRISAEVPPPILETVWPPELAAPVVRLRLSQGRMAMSWVAAQRLASAAGAQRIAFGPEAMPSRWVSMDRQAEHFVLPDGRTCQDWPLDEATCGRFVVARVQLAGREVLRTPLTGPGTGLLVFDPTGRLVTGTTLQAGLTYRIFAIERISRPDANSGDVNGQIVLEGELGRPPQRLEVGRRAFTFDFVAAPLEVLLSGKQVGKGPEAPWLGFPTIHLPHDVVTAPSLHVPGVGRIDLPGRLRQYHFPRPPQALRTPFNSRISLTADGREARMLLRVAPVDTKIDFAAPTSDGTRTVTVQSPGLSRVSLLTAEGKFLDRNSGTGGHIAIVLPAVAPESGAAGVSYRLELEFGTATLPIPILDQRLGFYIRTSTGSIRLVDRGTPATVHIDLARSCVLVGHVVRPQLRIDIEVRSFQRSTGLNPTCHMVRRLSDDFGDVELPLDEVLADLEPSLSHEVSVRFDGAANAFTFRVTDSIFDPEPRLRDEPYGRLRPGTTIDGEISFKSVAACAPWDGLDSRAMPALGVEQWSLPELPVTPGGRLGAPFVGDRRVGRVRFFFEDPTKEQLADPLLGALSRPRRVRPSMLRAELMRGTEARDRVLQGLENLATFEASQALDLVRVSRIDGTLSALLALEYGANGHSLLDLDDLRAVPLGAWWTAMHALGLIEKAEERVQRLHDLAEQRPELWAVLFVLGRFRNPNGKIRVQLEQFEVNLPPERPVLALADSGDFVPSPLRPSDLKKETWAALLRCWLAADTVAPRYDSSLFDQGVAPEALEEWINSLPREQTHRLRAPFRLAVAAARASLDPDMSPDARLSVRQFFLGRSVRRCWREMRPIIDGLHLAALRFYWQRLNSDSERLSRYLEQGLLVSDQALTEAYDATWGSNGTPQF